MIPIPVFFYCNISVFAILARGDGRSASLERTIQTGPTNHLLWLFVNSDQRTAINQIMIKPTLC